MTQILGMRFDNFFAKKTVQYVLILLTTHVTFIYFNGVFFIYKYKQLQKIFETKKQTTSLMYFLVPTLFYYLIRYFITMNKLKIMNWMVKNSICIFLGTAMYIKILSYTIDYYIVEHTKIICLSLLIMNSLIALADSYMYYLLDNIYYTKKHRFSKSIVLSIFIEEAPNYLFALLFNLIEMLFFKSCKPYLDLTCIFFTIIGLLLYNLEKNTTDFKILKENISQKLIIPQRNSSVLYPNKKSFNTYFLMITKIICTSSDTLIYFFLMSEMREQNFLVVYFSIEFLFKVLTLMPQQKYMWNFLLFKLFLMALTTFSVLVINLFGHYILIICLFVLNGLTNRMVYHCFDSAAITEKQELYCQLYIFGLVSCMVMWYGQKPDESFEDFIFFSSVRL